MFQASLKTIFAAVSIIVVCISAEANPSPGKLLVSCEDGQVTIHQSLKDPIKVRVVIQGDIQNTLYLGNFLSGFRIYENSSGKFLYAAEGVSIDWKPVENSHRFQGVYISGNDYLTTIYKKERGFFIKVSGSDRPGCVTMPDGEKVCWGPGPYINKEVELKGCALR